jgi:integrase
VHGLRATFSTWANETGAARPDVIEAALAHGEANAVRAAYLRAQYFQERRELAEAWGRFLTDSESDKLRGKRKAKAEPSSSTGARK